MDSNKPQKPKALSSEEIKKIIAEKEDKIKNNQKILKENE
jgi:hypothetical protein